VNDPFAVRGLSRDNPDVVWPNDNHADARTSGVEAFLGPFSRERQATVGFAEIPAHVGSAPGMGAVPMMMSMMCASVRFDRTRAQQTGR